MDKHWLVVMCGLCAMLALGVPALAADPCGGPYGPNSIDVPTGNIAANGANKWITPIGGQSTWKAINYGDQDMDAATCECVADTIPNPAGIKWVSTYLSAAPMTGTPKTLTAANDPHTGVGVKLELDDAGNPINDGGFVQVASQSVDIVIPNAETSAINNNPGCAAGTFGCDTYWSGTVSRAGFNLSFRDRQVTETSGKLDVDGCGVGPVGFGNGTVWLGINAANTWSSDHIWACLGANNLWPGGCQSSATLHWAIRSNGGTAHEYRAPTATWTVAPGGMTAAMTCGRS